MMKFIKLVDGLKSNANGFEYKIGVVNEADTWDSTTFDPTIMGGFNFSVDNKIIRQEIQFMMQKYLKMQK